MNLPTVKPESRAEPSFLELSGGRRIAYHLTPGKLPGVVFCGGFKSDMTGSKATTLEAFCKTRGQRFLRFDYTGHGQSSGEFEKGTIGAWAQDAMDMLTQVATGRNVLVGSSMGGWIMLLAALAKKPDVAALVGIASAPDFTEKLIWDQFTIDQKKQMDREGVVHLPSCYGEPPYPITRTLVEEARRHLLLDHPIALDMPVRLIHGMRDEDVPWRMSVTLMEKLASPDVMLRLVKNGGHRLSEPDQLELICQTVDEVLSRL